MKDTVSATELVRNLSSIIDYVRMTRIFVTITKGKQAIAQLGPVKRPGYPIAKLGELLAPSLTEQEANALSKGVNEVRTASELAEDPWES